MDDKSLEIYSRLIAVTAIKKAQFEADPSKAMEAAYKEIVRLSEILDAVHKALNPMPAYEFGLEHELRRPLDIRDEAFNRYEAARKAIAKY